MIFTNLGVYAWLILSEKRVHDCGRIAGTGCLLNLKNIYYIITTYVLFVKIVETLYVS